jgi:hypothetical protein
MYKFVVYSVFILTISACGIQKGVNSEDGTVSESLEQEQIYLPNSSFENHEINEWNWMGTSNGTGKSEIGIPENWSSCGEETCVYILDGVRSKYHKRSLMAEDGKFYVGLAINEESVAGQISIKLSGELEVNQDYRISFFTAFAEKYRHWYFASVYEKDTYNYKRYLHFKNKPVKLKIWASNDGCEEEELVYQSGLINHETWKETSIDFNVRSNYEYLIFEAVFPKGTTKPYNGNVLLDGISDLTKIEH